MACAAAALVASSAQAQTTGTWSTTTGGFFTNVAFWTEGVAPTGTGAIAYFVQDFVGSHTPSVPFHITNDTAVTLNAIVYSDTGTAGSSGDAQMEFHTYNGQKLTFGGAAPYIVNSNAYHSWITFANAGQTIVLGSEGLRVYGTGGVRFGAVEGPGDIVVIGTNSAGAGPVALAHFVANSPLFTGAIIVTNGAQISVWSSGTSILGSTNEPTILYDAGNLHFADRKYAVETPVAERIVFRGVRAAGSLSMAWCSNMAFTGVIRLETNGVIGHNQVQSAYDTMMTNFFRGTIEDDGNGRNLHIVHNPTTSPLLVTNPVSHLSPWIMTGTATYGGYTHLSGTVNWDGRRTHDTYLILAGSDNRLPTTTTLLLGGATNDAGISIGNIGASGILILSGISQEMAGIHTVGTGVQNRVVGGAPAFGTLALNIAAGTTNRYGGLLGDNRPYITSTTNGIVVTNTLPYQNNLNLVKKGNGLLNLTAASNTYAGTTTIEAGTLLINADQRNGGLITVANGGTLGGTGRVGAITSGGTVSPGNSIGTLTSFGNVSLGAGATLVLELQAPLTDPYDRLVMNGGLLNLNGSPNLSLSLYGGYVPNIGDSFTILSGFVGSGGGFDTAFDGTFDGKPDLGTFSVSGSTFKIDYNANDITLTVVPEPQTLGLLGLAALGGLLRRRIRR